MLWSGVIRCAHEGPLRSTSKRLAQCSPVHSITMTLCTGRRRSRTPRTQNRSPRLNPTPKPTEQDRRTDDHSVDRGGLRDHPRHSQQSAPRPSRTVQVGRQLRPNASSPYPRQDNGIGADIAEFKSAARASAAITAVTPILVAMSQESFALRAITTAPQSQTRRMRPWRRASARRQSSGLTGASRPGRFGPWPANRGC